MRAPATFGELLTRCHEGALEGGLSVALTVQPDELFGPLTYALGGSARSLKVEDVRVAKVDRPMELVVVVRGVNERWELEGLSALVHNLNDLYRDDDSVKVAVELGEWDDCLQLWCLPKAEARRWLAKGWFQPVNRAQLEVMVGGER